MDAAKRKNVIVGVLSLMTLPIGIWLIYQYFYAEPGQIDSFNLAEEAPSCVPVESGGFVLQIPITRVDEWDTISRITLVQSSGLILERAGLLEPGEDALEEFTPEKVAALVSAEDGWYRLGDVDPRGQVLALLLNADKGEYAFATSIRIATYGGETRWRDDLPLRVSISNGECAFTVSQDLLPDE